MLAQIYIEALLVNEELADQVWEAWDKGEIDDDFTNSMDADRYARQMIAFG